MLMTAILVKKMNEETTHVAGSVAELIARWQQGLELSNLQVAEAMGYDTAAVTRMIMTGQMRLPLNRVAQLAHAMDFDPADLMRRLLAETSPDVLAAIEACVGPLLFNLGEKRLVAALRRSGNGKALTPVYIDGATIVAVVIGT